MNFDELEKNYNSSSLLSVYEYIMKYVEDELFAKGLSDVLLHYRNALKSNKKRPLIYCLQKQMILWIVKTKCGI